MYLVRVVRRGGSFESYYHSPVNLNVAVIPASSAPCFVPSTSAPPVTTCHPAEYCIRESRSSTNVKLLGQPVLDISSSTKLRQRDEDRKKVGGNGKQTYPVRSQFG